MEPVSNTAAGAAYARTLSKTAHAERDYEISLTAFEIKQKTLRTNGCYSRPQSSTMSSKKSVKANMSCHHIPFLLRRQSGNTVVQQAIAS